MAGGGRSSAPVTPRSMSATGTDPLTSTITLSAVSCVSAKSCTAVGSSVAGYPSDDNTDYYTLMLAEHWNGSRWSVQSAPSPVANPSYNPEYPTFSGVSCSSTMACTAVGPFPTNDGPQVALAERWNGHAWALQNTANGTGTAGGDSMRSRVRQPRHAWPSGHTSVRTTFAWR